MKPIFTIQKHAATTLHYDFRLQIGDLLKSWVIPKGPSLNPKDKRLAILTEDHDLSFANFEGVIPEGHYGAGSIIVWDIGTFENRSIDNDQEISIEEAFENGKITIFLEGKKIKGIYSLIKVKNKDRPKDWLLIKHDDEYAKTNFNPVIELPNSVITNKSLEEI
jgi:DNA ligase D-like protein (predicted 3'-phosphoesterase)